jgi:hypothetical protein
LVAVQKAFRRWVQHGPLNAQNAAPTPNPSLTVPTNYLSPRKKRESGLPSPSTSFLLDPQGAPSPGGTARLLFTPAGTATPTATEAAAKRLRLDQLDVDSGAL